MYCLHVKCLYVIVYSFSAQNHMEEESLDDAIHVLRHHAEARLPLPYGIAAEAVVKVPGFNPSLVSDALLGFSCMRNTYFYETMVAWTAAGEVITFTVQTHGKVTTGTHGKVTSGYFCHESELWMLLLHPFTLFTSAAWLVDNWTLLPEWCWFSVSTVSKTYCGLEASLLLCCLCQTRV